MSGRRSFLDSNILVYAHDRSQGEKFEIARALVERLWEERSGAISTQVAQEFYVNVRKKTKRSVTAAEARRLVEDYLQWKVIVNDGAAILAAAEIERRYQVSFWDALIIQSAQVSGAEILFSEDLNHGQRFGSVTIRNPFLGTEA